MLYAKHIKDKEDIIKKKNRTKNICIYVVKLGVKLDERIET